MFCDNICINKPDNWETIEEQEDDEDDKIIRARKLCPVLGRYNILGDFVII